MTELFVGHGNEITMHFTLKLESGEIIDSTRERQPAVFQFGDGNLPAGFEACIQGMKAGEQASFQVTPEHAFGMPNPNNVQEFRRDQFAADMELVPGLVISFADASKAELPGIVKEVDGNRVVVDFNHPLAGRTLTFEVEILDVKPAGSAVSPEIH